MEEVKVSKREQRKKKLYAFIGKQKFAQEAYAKKMALNKEFKACLEAIEKEAYTSINDMPILNWWNLNETNDLRELLKKKRDISKIEGNALNFIFKELRQQYIKEFGFGKDVDEENTIIREILTRYCDMVINDDHKQYFFLDKAIKRLERLRKKKVSGSVSLIELAAGIKNTTGVNFSINECSVAEFFTFFKLAQKQANKTKK